MRDYCAGAMGIPPGVWSCWVVYVFLRWVGRCRGRPVVMLAWKGVGRDRVGFSGGSPPLGWFCWGGCGGGAGWRVTGGRFGCHFCNYYFWRVAGCRFWRGVVSWWGGVVFPVAGWVAGWAVGGGWRGVTPCSVAVYGTAVGSPGGRPVGCGGCGGCGWGGGFASGGVSAVNVERSAKRAAGQC